MSESGTPRPALAVTSLAGLVMILTGTFEQIIALAAVLFLVYYISGFLAVFVLRRTEPALARPYKAFGFPITTAIALLGSVALLMAAVAEDRRSGVVGAGFLLACGIAYWWLARRRRVRMLVVQAA